MKRKNFNDSLLAVRLPKALHDKFVAICDTQFKPASTLVREMIVDYVLNNQSVLLAQNPLGATHNVPKRAVQYSPSKQYVDPDIASEWE